MSLAIIIHGGKTSATAVGLGYIGDDEEDRTMLLVPLDEEIEGQLETMGAKTESSKIALVQEALKDALAESLEDLQIARSRIGTPARRWTQQELEQNADVEG